MNKKWGYLLAIIMAVIILLFAGGRIFSFINKKNKDVSPEYVFLYAENQIEDYPTTQGARSFAARCR